MHNFVYLAQRRSQEFSCEPNFGGGEPVLLNVIRGETCMPAACVFTEQGLTTPNTRGPGSREGKTTQSDQVDYADAFDTHVGSMRGPN